MLFRSLTNSPLSVRRMFCPCPTLYLIASSYLNSLGWTEIDFSEEFLHVVSILSEFIVAVGEEERCSFDDEIERRGPLAACFNFRHGFWSSKLDLSSPNTSDAFFNAMDVVERTEDSIEVNCFSFDEGILFCAGEARWST